MNVNEIMQNLTEEEIKNYKAKAIKIETFAGQTLEDIVINLEKLRRQGKLNYYANFNGIKLYSIDVTMNSAFKECLNCTRKTWIKREKRRLEESKKQIEKWKKEAQEKLPTWIEEGKKYIHPEKFSSWEKTCITCANGDYSGLEVECALQIMKMLEDGKTFKQIKEKFSDDGHSGMTYSGTMNIILHYAKRGPALFKFMNRRFCYNEGRKIINKIEEFNKKLDMGYKYDEIMESLKEHRIMDISISQDIPENCIAIDGIEHYHNYYNGTILVNKDLTFEGILNGDEYITGKILENEGITIRTFCNYKKASNYSGINQDNRIIARHEFYFVEYGAINSGISFISLSDSNKSYVDEIYLESEIKELKKWLDEYNQSMLCFLERNFESETQRSLSLLNDSLKENGFSSRILK